MGIMGTTYNINRHLFFAGLLLIILGIVLTMIIPLLLLPSLTNNTQIEHSGVAIVIIGPLPIIVSWGSLGPYLLVLVIIILIVLFLMFLVLKIPR